MDLITRLKLSSSEFDRNLDNSKKKVEEFQDKAEDTSKTLQDMSNSGAKSAKELLKEMTSLETGTRSISNYRKQLGQLTRDITDLSVNYANMTKEMQNSDLGREVILKINEMTKEAGKYKDAIMDAQASIKAMASDTANWDAVKQGMNVVSSTLQGVAAAGILSANSTEKLVAVIAKLKGIEAATNAVIQVGNALQKQSALMMGIARIQSAALTKATILQTTATKGATIAQRAFNLVAKANPYVLLATVILGAVAAIVAFTKKTNEAKEAQKKEQEQLERNKKEYEDYRNKVGGAVGDIVGKFELLQKSYKNLGTEMEKKKWINENANAFKELGLKVNNANDADEIFIKQSADVINALKARARASALEDLYKEKVKERTLAELDAEKKLTEAQKARTRYFSTNGGLPQDLKDAGFDVSDIKFDWGGGQSGAGWYELTPAQETKLNEYYRKRAQEAGQVIIDEIQSSIDIIEKQFDAATEESLALNNKVQSLLSQNANAANPNDDNAISKYVQGSRKELEEAISKTKELINTQKVGSKEWWEANTALESLNAKLLDLIRLERKLKYGEAFELPVLPNLIDKNLLDENGNIKLKSNQEPKLAVKVTVEKMSLNEAIDSISASISNYMNMGTQFVGSINSIYESFSNLATKIEESESIWEGFFAIFQAGVVLVEGFVGIMKSVGEALTLLNTLFNASTVAKTSDTTATEINTAATLKNAGAKGAAAAAGAGESVSSIPYVGAALAVAAIVAVVAALMSAKSKMKFSTGGIVPGIFGSGDKVNAWLNSGEMVLNQKQQSNLFKLLNENTMSSNGNAYGGVEFKIKGTELVGVLNNYLNKRNKI